MSFFLPISFAFFLVHILPTSPSLSLHVYPPTPLLIQPGFRLLSLGIWVSPWNLFEHMFAFVCILITFSDCSYFFGTTKIGQTTPTLVHTFLHARLLRV